MRSAPQASGAPPRRATKKRTSGCESCSRSRKWLLAGGYNELKYLSRAAMSSPTPSARGFSIWITAFAFIASSAAALAQDLSWVERSDRQTAIVFETLGAFYPEWMSHLGLERFDPGVMDLKPGRSKRLDAALDASVKRLAGAKESEGDARVREDLEIVID